MSNASLSNLICFISSTGIDRLKLKSGSELNSIIKLKVQERSGKNFSLLPRPFYHGLLKGCDDKEKNTNMLQKIKEGEKDLKLKGRKEETKRKTFQSA